jgi:hypothetical protein
MAMLFDNNLKANEHTNKPFEDVIVGRVGQFAIFNSVFKLRKVKKLLNIQISRCNQRK